MCNKDVRCEIAGAGFKLWQIADALGHNASYFSLKLRKELPDTEKQRIQQIIADLQAKAGE